MLGHAIANGLLDLLVALAFLTAGCLLFIALAVLATWLYDKYERRQVERFQRETASARAALLDLEEQHQDEIKCMGGRRHLETPR